jgi:hypothetical protein
MNQLNNEFQQLMQNELNKNSYKGDWEKWQPKKEEWLWQTTYHLFKLQKALDENNKELIKEYSLDLANFAEKSYITFGFNENKEKSKNVETIKKEETKLSNEILDY